MSLVFKIQNYTCQQKISKHPRYRHQRLMGIFQIKDKADVSYPGIEGSLEAPSTDIEESNVSLHTEGPNIEFEAPEGKIKKPKLQMPKFNVSFPNGKGPGVDFQKPVVDLSLPKGNVEMDTKARTNVDATDVGIDGKGAKFSFTHMRMPNIKFPGFKHEGTDLETDMSVQKGDVTFKGPEMKGNVEVPEVDLKVEGQKSGVQGTKFHLPTTDIKAPNISTPEIDTHLPKLIGKANVSCPGIEGSLEAPTIDIEGSNVSLDGEGPDLDFKDLEGKIKKPKFNVSLTKGKGQDMDFQKPDVDVSLPKGKVEMDRKAGINVDAPDVGIDGKGAKFSVPHIRMPKFKVQGFKHEGADLKTDISDKKGDITCEEPEIKGSTDVPEVDLKVEGHKGGIQRPKFNLPTTDIKAPKITTPEIDIHLPKLIGKADVSSPGIEGSLEAPSEDIKDSNVSLHTEGPNIEFESAEGKIKKPKFQIPKFNVSFPNGKGPGVDFQNPDVDLCLPKGKVEMDTKAGANVDAPDVGIDGKGAKFSFPHMSMPKIKIAGFKHEGADLETDISAKKGDVFFEGPEIKGNIEVPEVDLQVEGHEGGFQGTKFHLPSIGIKAPKILTPEIERHLPKLKGKAEVSSPGIEGSLEAPSVSGAAVNYYVDTEGPNVEREASKCNVMRQKLQMPKFNVSFPKGKEPDMDFLKPGVDVSLPKVKVKMNTPKGDINVDAPDINIDGKGEKFSQPHMRMPKINIPVLKHEGADLETDISVQKGDITFERPEIEGCIGVPEVGLKVVGHEGGIEGPKFHLPTTDIKAPKIPTPKIDTHIPKLKGKADVSWPGIEGSLEPPTVDIEGPNGNFDAEVPHLDYETPDGKIKKPKFQMPKFNVSFPKGKGPDADFQKTDVDMSLPKGKVKMDTKAGINVDAAPDVGIDGKGAKFSIPHMRMPKFKIPGFKQNEPDIDIGLRLQEPDIDAKEPKLKGDIEDRDVDLDVENGKSCSKTPTFHLTTLDVEAPKISAPDLDCDVNFPKFKSSAPDIEGSVAGPAIDITRPKVDGDVDVEESQGKIKIPDIHLPKFGLSWPKGERADADIDLSIESPDVGASLPEVKGKVDAPPP
uniref:Uncharacterized protein n=1 Tax=Eptatretus burgeri TaxID=7764 RepID=A0A8C4Q2F8_EPTBU